MSPRLALQSARRNAKRRKARADRVTIAQAHFDSAVKAKFRAQSLLGFGRLMPWHMEAGYEKQIRQAAEELEKARTS